MNYSVLVTSFMYYNLDHVQKMPKMKLTSEGYLLYLTFKQAFTLCAKKTNVCFEGVFLLINTNVTSSHLDI